MKFLHLILRNALRNRLRTVLTAGGSAFLLFLLVFMMTALTEMEAWQGEAASHRRVVVQHSTGLATPLYADLEGFLRGDAVAPHVTCVQKLSWVGAYYQEPSNFFANFAGDHLVFREMWDEFRVPDDAYAAYCARKDACLVGRSLARKFGWKVGQRITLMGTIYPVNPELEIVGIYTSHDLRLEERLDFRWDYFDELMNRRGIVGTYWLKAKGTEEMSRLKEIIDDHTRNSSDPTETMTEKEFGAQFMEMMGNVKALVSSMGAVVLLIMVMMTANTMAMSARERVTEIAVMRTLGFPARGILFLFVAEAMVVTALGAAFSLGGALLLFNVLKLSPAPQFFPYFFVTGSTVAVALVASFGAGLAASAVPAWMSARRKIVDGLRQVA